MRHIYRFLIGFSLSGGALSAGPVAAETNDLICRAGLLRVGNECLDCPKNPRCPAIPTGIADPRGVGDPRGRDDPRGPGRGPVRHGR
jgi:hypothetical protein